MTVNELEEMIFYMIHCDKEKVSKMDIPELEEKISDLQNAIIYLNWCNRICQTDENIYKKIQVEHTLDYFNKVYKSKKAV